MATTFFQSTDVIPVKQLCCILYGQPGARKTSLAQTANAPFTFAFDAGIYRAFGRGPCATFESWQDVMETWNAALGGGQEPLHKAIREASTLNVDTIGAGMRSLAEAIIQESPKNGNRLGGLSLAGYGILATRFSLWVNSVKQTGKDVVLVAHEDAEKIGDQPYYSPQVIGQKLYGDLMQVSDIVGRLHFHNGKRVIGWEPTDTYMAKTPPCGWGVQQLPDFGAQPHCLANLLAQAKASMGQISAASAAVALQVDEWRIWLDKAPSLKKFNERLPELARFQNGVKAQLWHLCVQHAEKQGWKRDDKVFVKADAKGGDA